MIIRYCFYSKGLKKMKWNYAEVLHDGTVILLFFPSGGQVFEMEEQRYSVVVKELSYETSKNLVHIQKPFILPHYTDRFVTDVYVSSALQITPRKVRFDYDKQYSIGSPLSQRFGEIDPLIGQMLE